jgi:putative salt-induced outer membrane protein YdiY
MVDPIADAHLRVSGPNEYFKRNYFDLVQMRKTRLKPYIAIILGVLTAFSTCLHADEIYLKNGDKISGVIQSSDLESTTIQTEAMGAVLVRKDFIERIDAPPPVIEAKGTRSPVWNNEIYAGFNRQRGNTSSSEAGGGFKLHRKTDGDEFDAKGYADYSERARTMDAQRYGGLVRYAFSFGGDKRWYNFYKIEADHDRFGNIDYRVTPSVGVGYWFSDTDDWKFMTEIGMGVAYTNFSLISKNETNLELIPRAYLEKKLFWNLTLSQEIVVYPALTDFGEYRLKSDCGAALFANQRHR